MAIPSEFPFLYHGKESIMHSNCILDSVANLLFVGNIQKKKSEMRSFKSNENIHEKEGGSYYVVSANKASSVTL